MLGPAVRRLLLVVACGFALSGVAIAADECVKFFPETGKARAVPCEEDLPSAPRESQVPAAPGKSEAAVAPTKSEAPAPSSPAAAACGACFAGEKRVALVIGNSAYARVPELDNPKNDAADMSAVLKQLGVTVIEGRDLDKLAMDRKIKEFANALTGADAGIFYYAGHGLQVNGNNYLVPVDAELSTTAALEFEMVRLDLVQRIMEDAAKTNILFLDACRNNPLSRNLARAMGTRAAAIGQGLAPAESGVGTLISFSTQPGAVALDGDGRNSPFSGALIKRIATPGEDILTVMTDVRNEVLAASGEKQVPWDNNALRARFYFNPGPKPAQTPLPTTPSPDAEAWAAAKGTSDPAVLEAFLKRYPDSFYGDLARSRLAELAKPPQEPPPSNKAPAVAAVEPADKPASGEDRLASIKKQVTEMTTTLLQAKEDTPFRETFCTMMATAQLLHQQKDQSEVQRLQNEHAALETKVGERGKLVHTALQSQLMDMVLGTPVDDAVPGTRLRETPEGEAFVKARDGLRMSCNCLREEVPPKRMICCDACDQRTLQRKAEKAFR